MKLLERPAENNAPTTLVSAARGAAATPELVAGDELVSGRFSIEYLLGRGGMGVVYAAFDRLRDQRVALKTLHVNEALYLHAIKREFRALADVHHPGLVRLHELFWSDERCFFTMDLLEGRDFLSYVQGQEQAPQPSGLALEPTLRAADVSSAVRRHPGRGDFDERRLTRALAQLVDAVDALHRAGKLHRDLKASNVLVDAQGKLTILDFGLALDRNSEPLQELVLAGTPLYMAPELFSGGAATPASDWYSVGVMLYQALTGEDPYPEDSGDLLLAKRLHEPAPPNLSGSSGRLGELARELLRHDAPKRPSVEMIRRTLGLTQPSTSAPPPRRLSALVGREPELGRLRAARALQSAGDAPVLVLVRGSSGIGKSALLERFAAESREGGVVLFGRCHEREWVPHKAFDEVIEALSEQLERLSEQELAGILPDDLTPLLDVFPVLVQLPAVLSRRSALRHVNPREQRRRAYSALAVLLRAFAARQRTAILIDDLHWGDADSARLLLDLLGRGEAPSCLFVMSYRAEGQSESPCLRQLFGEERKLTDFAQTITLDLQELTDAAARELSELWLPDSEARRPTLLAAICAEAKGNPLLLRELSSYAELWQREEQLDLTKVVKARLERLPDSARELFELVCVSGRPLSQAVAARALSTGLTDAVVNLQGERLIRERTSLRPDALDVYHDRIRQAALLQLSDAELRKRHGALARAHELAGAEEPEVIARHYQAAGERGPASEWAERAASESTALLALNRAAELYRLAFELCDEPIRRIALRVKLARALSDAGRGGEAAPLFLQAAADAPRSEALSLQRDGAEQFLVSGHTEQGLSALEKVLEAVGLSLPRTPRAALFDLGLTRAKIALRGLSFETKRAEDLDEARLLRADACRAAWALSFVNTILGAAFQARFLHEALRTGEPCRVALALGMEAIYRSTEGRHAEPRVQELRRAAREVAAKVEEPLVSAFEHLVLGQSSYMFGRWQTAADALEKTEKILLERCRNVTWELNSSRFFWGNSLVHLGRWRELGRRLDTWTLDAVDRGDLYAQASLNLIRTRTLTLASDEPRLAAEQVDAALAAWKSSDFGVQSFLAEVSRVQIALYSGDTKLALDQIERIRPAFSRSLMQRIQLCRIHMYHHTSYALIADAAARGETRHARRIARMAELLEKEDTPWAAAFARYVRAALLDLGGATAAAIDEYAAAERALEELGMSMYAACCRARRARRMAGEAGQNLRQTALATLRAQGILQPDRVIAMMAPGKG